MIELATNVFWMPPDHPTDRPALGAIAGERATLVVDAGNSLEHARLLLGELAARDLPPVRHVVLTHAHWDHVFGLAAFDAVGVATEETQRQLATMATWSWSDAALDERVEAGLEIAFCRDMIKAELSPAERSDLVLRVPEETFRAERTIDLGGRSVRLLHVGGDHASDSCVVVVAGVVAFLGDCIYHDLHVEPNVLTRRRLFPLLDRLLALDVDHCVLGHDDEPLSWAAFESQAGAMRAAGKAVRRHGQDNDAIRRTLAEEADAPGGASEALEYVKLFQAGLPHEIE